MKKEPVIWLNSFVFSPRSFFPKWSRISSQYKSLRVLFLASSKTSFVFLGFASKVCFEGEKTRYRIWQSIFWWETIAIFDLSAVCFQSHFRESQQLASERQTQRAVIHSQISLSHSYQCRNSLNVVLRSPFRYGFDYLSISNTSFCLSLTVSITFLSVIRSNGDETIIPDYDHPTIFIKSNCSGRWGRLPWPKGAVTVKYFLRLWISESHWSQTRRSSGLTDPFFEGCAVSSRMIVFFASTKYDKRSRQREIGPGCCECFVVDLSGIQTPFHSPFDFTVLRGRLYHLNVTAMENHAQSSKEPQPNAFTLEHELTVQACFVQDPNPFNFKPHLFVCSPKFVLSVGRFCSETKKSRYQSCPFRIRLTSANKSTRSIPSSYNEHFAGQPGSVRISTHSRFTISFGFENVFGSDLRINWKEVIDCAATPWCGISFARWVCSGQVWFRIWNSLTVLRLCHCSLLTDWIVSGNPEELGQLVKHAFHSFSNYRWQWKSNVNTVVSVLMSVRVVLEFRFILLSFHHAQVCDFAINRRIIHEVSDSERVGCITVWAANIGAFPIILGPRSTWACFDEVP